MKKKIASRKSSLLARLLLFIALPSLISISSCKDGEPANGDGNKVFTVNCVTLSRQQVQTWVANGWTRPDSATRIKQLLLQFYSSNPAMLNSNMDLLVYPAINSSNIYTKGEQVMAIDTACKGLKITGPVIFGNNMANFDSLKIVNPDGTLKKFDFIRFVPRLYSKDTRYICFSIEVVIDGRVDEVFGDGSLPCPPYCCPPDCWYEEEKK